MRALILIYVFLICMSLKSQSLDSLMLEINPAQEEVVMATFKSPKLVLLQTNETQKKYALTFWIGHRFGDIGGEFGGSHTLYGLDAATDIHLGLDYGITNDFTVGIGRSRFNETYHVLAKFRLLKQKEEGMPLSVTLFGQSGWITRKENFQNEFPAETDRITHFLQVILARKFSPSLSLMLNPGYLIRPVVTDAFDQNNFLVIGMGGRLKITKRFSLIADYTLVNGLDRPEDTEFTYYNPLGIGLEIETGGHVFSLNFQNATYITENNFIPYTQKSWEDGGVRFGFTISRNFYLGPKNGPSGTGGY
ncbi:hypothetical protein FHG64_02985 [Antarcticibacterium flavum]|uniref:DUF5777 domain-containing protein n=1 Tax=Antarcticibacterium flavum TaxID=2058175 RepID=A0A5B7WZL9_9FLAO|nr:MULTISPECIES: DUF5777 family beta-barrel protein [Antarcticibacterium]MCM4161248.1 hypothetical protein [Antarcticibacterium sp. W02-3]QCY68435.1 hypothetical protein FHG64_02985 [Antarcticibacterium flavum]